MRRSSPALRADVTRVEFVEALRATKAARELLVEAERAHHAAREAFLDVVPRLLEQTTHRQAARLLGVSTAALWKALRARERRDEQHDQRRAA